MFSLRHVQCLMKLHSSSTQCQLAVRMSKALWVMQLEMMATPVLHQGKGQAAQPPGRRRGLCTKKKPKQLSYGSDIGMLSDISS